MEPADSIGRVGFRAWYERRLIEAHVWLVTSLLCMIVIAAVLEAFPFRGPPARALAIGAFVFVAGLAGVQALRRYLGMLTEAIGLGSRATCPDCGGYGRFSMISAHAARCRNCAREWRLVD
jgi:hypothetical protein